MGDYYRGNCQVSIGTRELVFRNSDAALTTLKHIDLLQDDDWVIAEPYLKSEKRYPIGSGENVGKISYLGYDASEESIPTFLQSGVALFYTLGNCVTTGTALGTPFTDTVASGGGTTSIVMTTNTAMTTNEHAGRSVEVTSGDESGNVYTIVSNTANTLVVEDATTAGIDADGISITEAPFTHTITEKRNRPSFSLHVEQEETSENIRRDLIGVIMKTLGITIEKDADATQDWGISVSKSVAGSDLAAPTANAVDLYNWCHFKSPGAFTLSYNSANPITTDDVEMVSVEITNNSNLTKTISNCWPNKKINGTREYSIKMHIFPQNDTLYNLRNTKHTDYVTDLALTLKLARSATDYISIAWDKLRLIDYPNKIPSKDDNIVGLDIEFALAPSNTLTCVVVDALNASYYERQTQT